jgi:predicted 3-demethylubiquinone-9 3-methyltransferase (glyoxalase superfamily)
MQLTPKILPCLWFDGQAEQAVAFYAGIFRSARVGRVTRFGREGFEIHGRPEGSVMTVEFELEGQSFVALNGGPAFRFNEAVSFQVLCEDQDEVDYFWERLGADGDPQAQQCGWLKDRFGLSWQVITRGLGELVGDPGSPNSARAMRAMLKMKKIDLEKIRRAYDGAA